MNGMDDNGDEHNFSDDGFDDLNANTLLQLEQNAISFTQPAQSQAARTKPIQRPLPKSRPPQPARRPLVRAQPNARPPSPVQAKEENTFGDAFDDDSFEWIGDDRVPTPVEEEQPIFPQQQRLPSEMTQREQWRQERFGRPLPPYRPPLPQTKRLPSSQVQRQSSRMANTLHDGTQQQDRAVFDLSQAVPNGQKPSEQEEALRLRIEELMRERDNMTTELHSTKSKIMEQQGEIDIIRENKTKEAKVADRQMIALKKSMHEESMKHKAALDAIAKKNSEIETQNQFLNRELAQEAEKTKALAIRLKEQPRERAADIVTTPKKGPANSLRDGFDDDEVMAVSPIKSARHSKPPTPTAAGKRKRKADKESPIKPLVLRQSSTAPSQPEQAQADKTAKIGVIVRKDRQAQRHLQFIQKILNYQPKFGGERLIELFMKHSFPSDAKTLSSIILDATSKLSGPDLRPDCLQIFISLWSRCMKEKYYDPVLLLVDVIDYILDVQPAILTRSLVTNVLPCITSTIDINAFTRFKHSPVYHNNLGQFRSTPQSALNALVPTQPPLQLLYKLTCLTLPSMQLHSHLWGTLSTDFILMMLNPWQPIADILMIFSLLSTSILPSTFGNICPDPAQQSQMEKHIIDRVCYLLWEIPKVDEGLLSPTRADLVHFRLSAMTLLGELAFSSAPPHTEPCHGSSILAQHPSAIARIVRCLYDSVATLYTLPPEKVTTPLNDLINLGVKVLHHLVSLHSENIDLSQKLSAVNGGIHKHRVVLTRLAFSEGWYVDRGITDETARLATTMLEDSVTPDEAETMIEAFPGFEGRKTNRLDDEEEMQGIEEGS